MCWMSAPGHLWDSGNLSSGNSVLSASNTLISAPSPSSSAVLLSNALHIVQLVESLWFPRRPLLSALTASSLAFSKTSRWASNLLLLLSVLIRKRQHFSSLLLVHWPRRRILMGCQRVTEARLCRSVATDGYAKAPLAASSLPLQLSLHWPVAAHQAAALADLPLFSRDSARFCFVDSRCNPASDSRCAASIATIRSAATDSAVRLASTWISISRS